MSRTTVALFAGYTLLSVAGLLLLRNYIDAAYSAARGDGGAAHDVVLAAVGVLCYLSGFGMWLAILARVPLTRAYPTAIGLTLVFTTLAAWALLHEKVGVREVVGILAVFVGIWILSSS
jgi:drug/metabolite transporter (DMT)-like permease